MRENHGFITNRSLFCNKKRIHRLRRFLRLCFESGKVLKLKLDFSERPHTTSDLWFSASLREMMFLLEFFMVCIYKKACLEWGKVAAINI